MLTVIAILVLYLLALVPLVYLWVSGVDDMKDKHPDYKGDDFLKD
jgi:hypothetical protein